MSDTFELPPTAGLEAAYQRNLARVKAHPREELARGRGDVIAGRHNFFTGLKALEPHRATLEQKWNKARVDALFADADLADGAVFAAQRAEGFEKEERRLAEDISRSFVLRDQGLTVLEGAVKFGLLPDARVSAIRAGTGPLDTAFDLINVVAVCREFETALKNKTPFTTEWLADAQTLGNSLQSRITPKGQKPSEEAATDAREEAIDVALRFWTLVAEKHAEARLAGREIFGRAVSKHVPALQAKIPAPEKKTEEPTGT